MRLTTRQTGIISYAGLEEGALWAAAKRMFAQSDEPVPERFRSFLPVFPIELVQNMSYVGRRERNLARVSPAGFSTDPDEYHRLLCAELPDLYTGENALRNFDSEGRYRGGGAVTVDRAWATLFPQYQPFLGERLVIHMIGGGHQAVAVPESIFPRGGGILEGAERELRVTARCAHYMAYLKTRLEMGEKYDSVRFEEDYLRLNGLSAVCVRQKELGRAMQDLSILRGLDDGAPEEKGLFTLNAKRAEGVRQYAPWRYACDTFEESPVTRATSRLLQLAFDEDAAPGDLWVSYQDAGEYIDRQRMTLDVRALCEGFQIAPAYDPATRGGRYPTVVRVAAVRDRELRPLVADALNNPAYGSGMNPLGMLNKLVYLPDSRELLRRRRLALEPVSLTCENATIGSEDYRRMRAMARWQEWKGRLVDALYRRESALSQIQVDTSAYDHANDLLTRRVEAIEREAQRAAVSLPAAQLSGYDADIDYLRRMWRHREGVPEGEKQEAVLFAPDALRELCIESGYAMRSAVRTFDLAQLLTETPEDELSSASEKDDAGLPLPEQDAAEPPASKEAPPADPAPSARREAGEAAPVEAESSAPEATPAAKPAKAPRRVKLKKAVKTPRASMPRFEQIDMFTAVEQAAAEDLPPVPAESGNADEAPAPYVVRSLSQLTGARGEVRPGMMARLMKDTRDNKADGRA